MGQIGIGLMKRALPDDSPRAWATTVAAYVDADPRRAAVWHPRHAQDPGAPDGAGRQGRGAADDVPGALLRSPHRRRPRGRDVPGAGEGKPGGSGAPGAGSVSVRRRARHGHRGSIRNIAPPLSVTGTWVNPPFWLIQVRMGCG